jgi:hypothetical protein
VVSQFKGYDAGYEGPIAPYVVLTQTQGRFSECGCLGQNYKPLATGGDPNGQRFVVEGIVAEGISDQRQHDRRALMHDLDTLGKAMAGDAKFGEHDKAEQAAYETMFGKAREVFDLGKEDEALRDRYGRNHFGQCCLVARRLVEAGVPYVTINYRGWDTHKQHFQTMQRKMPEMDARPWQRCWPTWTSAVCWTAPSSGGAGSSGAAPRYSGSPLGTVDAATSAAAFRWWWPAAGSRGGKVVGAIQRQPADEVAKRPVYPVDLLGSIYDAAGHRPRGEAAQPPQPRPDRVAGAGRRGQEPPAAQGDYAVMRRVALIALDDGRVVVSPGVGPDRRARSAVSAISTRPAGSAARPCRCSSAASSSTASKAST